VVVVFWKRTPPARHSSWSQTNNIDGNSWTLGRFLHSFPW
jgi:hypothetical protein